MKIDRVEARTIPDTRGKPTVEATLFAGVFTATASVPSGKSTGSHEAFELRDPDGGVVRAVENVNGEIARALVNRRFSTPDDLDASLIELDGTPNKSRLGANAMLAVSVAAQRLSALLQNAPVWQAIAKRAGHHANQVGVVAGTTPAAPRLFVNCIEGGAHAGFRLPFQEHLLVFEGKASEMVPLARELFSKLGEKLGNVPTGDEGGYSPTFDTLERPLEILAELVSAFPNISIAVDAAASELFRDGVYRLFGKSYAAEMLTRIYADLTGRFPLHSIEDPFDENACGDFAILTAALGGGILIVGDDLTVTDPTRIKAAAQCKEINAVIIKPNQIGTVKEALEAVKEARAAGFAVIASHRSGETADTFIADFAYGIGAYGLKAGGFLQRERLAKYDRLLAIERETEGCSVGIKYIS